MANKDLDQMDPTVSQIREPKPPKKKGVLSGGGLGQLGKPEDKKDPDEETKPQ